jgi:hypothetical protein
VYVYLQESTKGMQSLAAKRSFEAYSSSYGVKVQQYLADNGRFAEHLFLNHCDKLGQKVSLCGVSAYFQNGIAERRIKDFTERSRTSRYTPFTGDPQQSQSTCGHMHFATSMRYTTPLLP